ncbi:MAG: hypothetical protein RMK29_07070 [Myxococcales bacterium]|nr:hypothetical protein [Myxococcota bacterium]MDW8281455.1 hypothetical protein [Myxococcales bacterium]
MRIWLLPGLTTFVALVASWSLLPHARSQWQEEPAGPPRLVEPAATMLQRLQPRQEALSLPLLLPCAGGLFEALLDAGASLPARGEGWSVSVAMPVGLPPGPHRLLVRARGCGGDGLLRHSHVSLIQLPEELPAPLLEVARGVDPVGLYAAVRGTPGAEVDLVLLTEAGEQLVGTLPLLASGMGGMDLPLPLERAHLLRARQRLPGAPERNPSQLSDPPTLSERTQLANRPPSSVALVARLSVGARDVRWSWDLTLPDGLFPGPLPPWRALQGVVPVSLRIGPTASGPLERFNCPVQDATSERLPGATRLRGQCHLVGSEVLRTLLFHSGARLHLEVAGDPDLHLPASLEAVPDQGARLAEAQPPPLAYSGWIIATGEPGPYLRFARRTVLPLVDMPEPAVLLLYPARRIAEHAQEVIALVLRLLPLMILLPLLGQLSLTALLLLLVIGGAGSPLVWAAAVAPQPGAPRDALQLGVALLWELAAVSWVVAALRSHGLLRSVPKLLILLIFLSIPLFWLYVLGNRLIAGMAERGGSLSVGLGAGLALLALLATARLARLAGLARRWQGSLVFIGVLVLVMDGLEPAQLYVDAVAGRLALLSPAWTALAAAALYLRYGTPVERLLWPLFLSTLPPLAMDHGLPLGLLAALLVYRIWRRHLQPVPCAPAATEEGDPRPAEVEAVLLAVGDHPVAKVHEERAALEARLRRGEVSPEAYRLAQEALAAREAEAAAQGYERRYQELPPILACGTAEGPVADAGRALRLALAPTVLYLLFLLLVKEPFDPGRLLQQVLGALRLIIQIGGMCFFFGFAFGALPGRNGLIKAMAVTLLTVACEVPSAVLTWYRPEDMGRGLVRWVGVLGILGWVGLGGFDLYRLRKANRGLFDLARVRGYSRGFALTTSVILAIFTAVVSGVTGRLSAMVTSAMVGPAGTGAEIVSAPRPSAQ